MSKMTQQFIFTAYVIGLDNGENILNDSKSDKKETTPSNISKQRLYTRK